MGRAEMKRVRDWKLWAGVLISGLFLWLAFRKADLRDVGRAFSEARYVWLIPSIAANFIGLWIRCVRWGVLLRPLRRVRMKNLFPSTMIGFMANNLLPARIGEFVRALVLGRKTGVRVSAAFATIVLERVFDGMTILLFLLVTVGLLNLPFPDWLRKASLASFGGIGLMLFLLVMLKTKTGAVLGFFGVFLRPFPPTLRARALGFLESFAEGLHMLRDWKSVVVGSALSLCLWVFPALSLHFGLLAAGIHLPLAASVFVLVILCIGVAVPSAPGFVGTIQLVSVISLELFGVARPQALSFSILYHLSQYIPVTGLGLIYFFSEGLSFSKIRSAGPAHDTDGGSSVIKPE
jgi:glycosyltransferase 2 family protein